MIKQLLQVGAFMDLFKQRKNTQPVTECPEWLSDLGFKLMREETNEMLDAFCSKDGITQVKPDVLLDALCDQLYVTFGNAHRFGLALLLPVAFRKVHESNMSKLWTNDEVQDLSRVKKMGGKRFEPVRLGNDDQRWVVYNEEDKVIKSPSYEPANLKDLIDELDGQELIDFAHAGRIVYGELPELDYNPDDYPEED